MEDVPDFALEMEDVPNSTPSKWVNMFWHSWSVWSGHMESIVPPVCFG